MSGNRPRPLIIAHRGACGYLPEHTLEAKALAYGMGADFLEQDVVATRDDQLVVLHDIYLDTVTDVALRYPDRKRDDGHYYVRDFDLDEIRTLNVHERRSADGISPVFDGRFPTDSGRFSIPSLEDEIQFVQGLNTASGGNVGIYPEIKRPAFHHGEGVDVAVLMLELLERYGYRSADDAVFLQCFDAVEVRRIRDELGSQLKLVQLIGENSWGESTTDYDYLKTSAGLSDIARFADAIGPWIGQLYTEADIDGNPVSTGMVSAAKDAGLAVHPFTFRADALAPGFESFDAMVGWFIEVLGVDGLFTDFPDKSLSVCGRINS